MIILFNDKIKWFKQGSLEYHHALVDAKFADLRKIEKGSYRNYVKWLRKQIKNDS